MITFGNAYFVEAREIEVLAKENSGNAAYPYRLTVETKSHSKYSVDFVNKDFRDREAERIACEVERIHLNYDITVDVIHDMVAKEIEKMRPFLRRIEKAVTIQKGEQHDEL
ncbi:MAG: hypothetical protein IJF32_04065 [Oscillospiraceae bacterium]|nr:hypothetical protein [Oscillospiraceae bacterium]